MINQTLDNFISNCSNNFDKIPETRKKELHKLSLYISERINESTALTFICVHNSRRSHLSQIWAQVAAHHFGFNNITTYSGGTEITQLYPKIIETLTLNGLEIETLSKGENPIYSIKYNSNSHPILGFSKLFDSSFNAKDGFAAIMVCSAADTNCPYISNAAKRILLPFDDPKEFDGTDLQNKKYLERSVQIATEMLYTFSMVEH